MDARSGLVFPDRYTETLSDQIEVILVPSEGGGLIRDRGSLTLLPWRAT